MNSRERVMNAVNYLKPDRIPLWKVSHFQEFTKKWHEYKKIGYETDPADYYGYDTFVYNGVEGFFPSSSKLIKTDVEFDVIRDEWGRLVRRSNKKYFSETLEFPIKEYKDLDKLVSESENSDIRFSGIDSILLKQKEKGRCIYAKAGGIYIRSHNLVSEEDLLVNMVIDEGFCNELFDRVANHLTQMALVTLQRTDAWDTGLWIYDDMASTYNVMFSPELFEKYMLPRYQKMISICRTAGCKHFFLHSDGNIGPVLDMLLEAGFEGFNPLEPRSGLDLIHLREKYGKKIVFFGGVCNTEILPRGDKKEIENHVLPLLELGREGGVILGMASLAQDVSPYVYDFYMSLIKKFGQYN